MSLGERILSYLEGCPPGNTYTALQIAKAVGLKTAKDVNRTLYDLRKEGRLCVSNGSPPQWSLQKSDIVTHGTSKTQLCEDERNLVEVLKGDGDGKGMTAKQIARQSNQDRKDVNRALYSLSGKGKVKKLDGEGWTVSDSGNEVSDLGESVTEEDSCDKAETGLSFSGAFDIVKKLGEGGYGDVYQVQHKIDDRLYALKIVEYDREAEREVKALATCDHPNIVRYITAWHETFNWSTLDKDSKSQQSSLKSQRCLFIQMEYCEGGTLFSWLEDRNFGRSVRTTQEALEVFQQVVHGVEYIHSKGFIHRDLKPENILFMAECRVKIGDFGLVTSVTNQNGGIMKRTVGKGTETYMSPEQMIQSEYDEKTDIFPLGLICFELLWKLTTGFERAKIWPSLRNQVFPDEFRKTYSSEHKFIYKMLSKSPEKRPTATEIFKFIKTFLPSESGHLKQKTM
ncbi:hypothetical protein ACEWY4_021084 [Coilia grayii]|uniref:non-specific serine/threonine protein kinase n=1 Tax=Coilia grayii TaxID=363190 RepID=A0ABD1J9B8_9TELE